MRCTEKCVVLTSKPVITLSALMLFLPNALSAPAYASTGTAIDSTFSVSAGDKTYPVGYTMDNGGSITNAEFDMPNLSLFLDIESPADGHLELTFPRQTYDALSFTERFVIVFVDDQEVFPSTEYSCEQISFRIPLLEGSEQVGLSANLLPEVSFEYPQRIDIIKTVELLDEEFGMRVRTDSIKCSISLIEDEKKVHIDIQGRTEAEVEQGYFRLTVPHDLLGGNYTVLVDGQQVDFQEQIFFIRNNADVTAESAIRDDFSPYRASHLTISYPLEAESIEVVGTSIFPEPGAPDLNPMRNLHEDPIVLSYDISGKDSSHTAIDFLFTDADSGELVKSVTFDMEITKVDEEMPLLIDEFYAENGTIAFDMTHEGPMQISGVRNEFRAWMPEPGAEVIPMRLPLEPDASYWLKIDVVTTDYAHDFHPYPEESVYLYFDTDGSEIGAIRIVPEFPYHLVLVISALVGTIIAIGRTGSLARFYNHSG